jgi:hypothetical protein
MKLFNKKSILDILISLSLGATIGFTIHYFGGSKNAPWICAMAAGAVSLSRLNKKHETKTK